jgi:glycogen operon protein
VIYELHVKGFSIQNPRLPPDLRGTYSGLGHPASIDYLRRLGVTAVELMPVHQFVHEGHLLDKGLRNYWGYYTIGYFAPHDEYGTRDGNVLAEFKHMVKALHQAGIEVILDVVYNHTAEGNHLGPTLSFRGIDNPAYYRLSPDDARYYMDYTGTGNTLNMRHPHVLQLLMDSLRYWVEHMHVDGFRFDLASALARELHAVDRLSAFFDVIQQDPVISRSKLIAEPWDVGEGGYQVGNFPPLWSEWNGRYRDCVRDVWRGERRPLGELGYRLSGSSDLYAAAARRPHASINFITAHDGFTLRDLVSYDHKHNQDNGEGGKDGTDDNRSWNCGVEGPTDDPVVTGLRARQTRNLLVTLFTSQGVPMLLSGDEQGHSQNGNNNAYCQDNRTTWLDWDRVDTELLDFTRQLIGFYREHPVFRRRGWFQGRPIFAGEANDIAWFTPKGEPMTEAGWKEPGANVLGVFLNGLGIETPGPRGERLLDDSFYIVYNAHHEPVAFTIPAVLRGRWGLILDTRTGFLAEAGAPVLEAGAAHAAAGRTVSMFRKVG